MPNMSYCRFQNTVADLKDCCDNMDLDADADVSEVKARMRLLKLCYDIANDYEGEIEDIIEGAQTRKNAYFGG